MVSLCHIYLAKIIFFYTLLTIHVCYTFRPWFTLAESPQPRDVIFLIDMYASENLKSKKLNYAVFKNIMESLSSNDRVYESMATTLLT